MNEKGNGFQYTYSAKEQAELKKIREKYESREENKMERLRRLDSSVSQRALGIALTLGIIGVLIMGFGMSLVMSELAAAIGLSSRAALPLGIAIGVIGGIIAGMAYPIHELTLKRMRRKIAPEIIRLTDELVK